MWHGFEPELRRQLAALREMVALRRQTPTKEWPLIFVGDHDVLLVVRQWPDGSLTAYATSKYSDEIRRRSTPPAD